MYLAVTGRPDIMYAVSWLLRCYTKPTKTHWYSAKYVLRSMKIPIKTVYDKENVGGMQFGWPFRFKLN